MKCRGKFKFKGLTEKQGGEFKNNRGEMIAYKGSYALKVDEITEEGIFERIFKIALDSPLVQELADKELYSDIILDFDVKFYSSGVGLIPVAIVQK